MSKYQIIKVSGCIIMLLLPPACSLGYNSAAHVPPGKPAHYGCQQAHGQELLNTFEALCRQISNVKGNYTLAGVINITDKANPSQNMDHVKFLFCKQGDDFYYRLGATTSINGQGAYLFINDQTKRILVSEQKQVEYDNALARLGDMGKNIESEHYQLVSKINGDEQTISLINEHHISCKQYALTFNRHTMTISRLYMRLSDLRAPLRTDNEKIVDVGISEWDDTADIEKYPSKKTILKNINGGWVAVNAFKNYQVIKM